MSVIYQLTKTSFIGIALFVGTMAFASEFDPIAATNAYLASQSAEDIANTNGYVNTSYLIMVLELLMDLFIVYLVLSTGWSRKWRDLAERKLQNKFLQAFIYVPIFIIVSSAISLPLTWFSEFYTEHKYGLSTQEFGAWFVELVQGSAISAVIFSIFVALLYLVIRRSPTRWWIWGSSLSIVFLAVIMFLSPILIQPIFNDYRPMDEGPLKENILSIARANGMKADDVKQVDESRQTNRISANVSGLFGSTRIALNDNLLNRASEDGVEAVMAHEIGHYVLNHLWGNMSNFTLIFIACFALTAGSFNTITQRKGIEWGVRGIDDYAGLPLLYALVAVLLFVSTPVLNKMTYAAEAEADIFAINATNNPDAWAEVALMTAKYRKLHPPEWEENWLNHHPSPYVRIYTAMRWKAENLSDTPLQKDDK